MLSTASDRDSKPQAVVRPSRQARVAHELLRLIMRPVMAVPPLRAVGFRTATWFDAAAGLRPTPPGITREGIHLDGFDAEIVRPAGSHVGLSDGVILYFHGGGFISGGLNTHRPVVASIARRAGLPVMSVGYRYLPKATFTESTDDCLAAYRWLLDRGVDPAKVVFAGDSAGGYLVFAAALKAIDSGFRTPAGLVGISAWLDLDCTEKRGHPNALTDALRPVDALAMVGKMGASVDGALDPALSPVNGDLTKLPPTLLIAAADEVLRVDAELMSSRLDAAGVACELQVWPGQVHAFPAVFPGFPESREALSGIARFINSRINAKSYPSRASTA